MQKKYFWVCILFATAVQTLCAQRLVVGIVVDQMRWDALQRYAARYESGGLRRLMQEGTQWTMCHVPYLPAVTAAGHSSIYTGAMPAIHGIVSNNFEANGNYGTSVSDPQEYILGNATQTKPGGSSPRKLLSTTLGDELRMASAKKSKVISLALKDRSAILSGGHTANLALWWDDSKKEFVTSSYYAKQLPTWVKAFNTQQQDSILMSRNWPEHLRYPISTYLHPRDTLCELPVGKGMNDTPWGAVLTIELAKKALRAEKLGKTKANSKKALPDMLCISISSTDAIAHRVGPDSPLMEDTYLHLDSALAGFFHTLDKEVGRNQWLCFLTADHAGQHAPLFRAKYRIPVEIWESTTAMDSIRKAIETKYGTMAAKAVKRINSFRLSIDEELLQTLRLNPQDIIQEACNTLQRMPQVQYAYDIRRPAPHVPIWLHQMAANGYHPNRSGQIIIIPRSGVSEAMLYGKQNYRGTSHALWTPEDTHIPLIIMGPHVPRGKRITKKVEIIDIAPTIAQLLGIQQPSGCNGHNLLP